MPHYYLLNKKSKVVNEFGAADNSAAQAVMATWCSNNLMRVTLCRALRIGTPSVAISPPVVDDQPA